MPSTRGRAEALFAGGVAAVVLLGAVWAFLAFAVTPLHESPAAVRSTPAAEPAAQYAAAVETSRRRARELVAGLDTPGLSLAVALDGEVVWAEGFGWTDVEARAPVTALTRYRLGALSKPLTAFGAALLHDQGRLDLDAPVQRYVPQYPAKQWTVTTRQLMGDVAGVHRPRGDNRDDSMPGRSCRSLGDAVAELTTDPLFFEPGTEYRYSVWGWVLVSAAIQGAAGEPFEIFMTRRVFAPLGLERTTVAEFSGLDNLPSNRQQRWILGVPAGVETDSLPEYSCLAGGGAFLSTPSDLVRFGSAMFTPGLLRAETIAAFQAPGRLASGAATTYGLGWTVGNVELAGGTTRMLSHRGSPRGGGIALATFPDRRLAVAAAVRMLDSNAVLSFARDVAADFARADAGP